MRILIVGAGAVGGYYGARLIEAGADVTFLVRPRRLSQLETDGLRVTSAKGDFSRSVQAITQAKAADRFDTIMLTCKAYDFGAAVDAIGPVAQSAAIVPLLNGIAHMETLNARFGAGRVLGGVAKISATLGEDGVIRHLNDWNYLWFGEQSGAVTPRVTALAAAFKTTPVEAVAVSNIMQRLWEKMVHLATAAGMNSLMRANTGQIVRTTEGAQLVREFLAIHADIATREGYPPGGAFMEECRAMIGNPASRQAASMLRDIERGGPTEGEHIFGYLLAKARQHGIDPMLHRIVFAHLQAHDERRRDPVPV